MCNRTPSVEASPILDIVDLSYRYPGAETEALHNISLSAERGECVCLTGPSGSGKSTLLLAISGLLEGGTLSGECWVDESVAWPSVGIVFQNADSQILSTTVVDEVAFGPSNLSVPANEIDQRSRKALEAVGLTGYETRNVEDLSAGEKHRLTLAAVLSMEPSILLLDEPTAQLDGKAKNALRTILKDLKERSYTIIVADHDVRPYEGIADRFIFIDHGVIEKETDRIPFKPIECLSRMVSRPPAREVPGEPVIDLRDLHFSRQKELPVITDLSIKVLAGERIHICGANGAGKSTLFKLITGLLRPDSGSISILNLLNPKPENLRGKVGLLLQNPVRQIFENTVREEVAFPLKRRGLGSEPTYARVSEALALCGMLNFADRSPFTLSYGQQHRVTLASVIALNPQIFLLDEPFSGLEFEFRYRILDILKEYNEREGCTLVLTSHDPLVDPAWADRSYLLDAGKLVPEAAI
jgi:energy-coupling factor transport system ATP-binding protein